MYLVIRSGLLLALLATACGSAGPPAASAGDRAKAPAAPSAELVPGIVVDPAAGALYLAVPGGGIEALDAATGRPLWSSEEAARPLLAVGGRLLAQRESGTGLPLALLNAAGGGLLRRFDAPLPVGVRASVDQSLQADFRLAARASGDGAILEWEYLERDPSGTSPPDGRAFARRDLGSLRLDLESGQAAPPGEDEAAAGEPLPEPVELLVAAGELRPPWRAGAVLAAAQQLWEPAAGRLVLRRWLATTGEALPEVTLLEGRAVAVLPSADKRHLLVVTTRAGEAAGPEPYLWSLHLLATGEAVLERPAARSATPFVLLAGRLIFVEPPSGRRVEGRWEERPRRLRALEAASGVELWQRPVRDPAFRGPVPPRPQPPSEG